MNKEIKKELEAQLGEPIHFNESGGFKYPTLISTAAMRLILFKRGALDYASEEQKGIIIPEIAALQEIVREIRVAELKQHIESINQELKELGA